MLLCDAPRNTAVFVKEVNDENNYLMQHGITPGESLRVLSNYSTQPMLIKIRNSYIALDAFYTKYITVEFQK